MSKQETSEHKAKETPIIQHRIGWLDSNNEPSLIHRGITNNPAMKTTICGHNITGIIARIVPTESDGISRYCRVCFTNVSTNLIWRIDKDNQDNQNIEDNPDNEDKRNSDTSPDELIKTHISEDETDSPLTSKEELKHIGMMQHASRERTRKADIAEDIAEDEMSDKNIEKEKYNEAEKFIDNIK